MKAIYKHIYFKAMQILNSLPCLKNREEVIVKKIQKYLNKALKKEK